MNGKRGTGAGFTLLELMVALAITGIVVLLVHQVFSLVTDTSRTLREATLERDGRANSRQWLRDAFLSTETGGDAGSFEGHPDKASFSTWILVPGSWMERSRVMIRVVDGRLSVTGIPVELVFPDSVSNVAFDYLLEPGLSSRWVREWVSPVSAPLGVRMRLTRVRPDCNQTQPASGEPLCMVTDTALYLIGGRG